MSAVDTATAAALLDELTAICANAARTILDWSGKGGARTKADGSPVTPADEAAEDAIRTALERLVPGLPIISEEHASREKPQLPSGGHAGYFLVDPLDGTREFIAGRDEYTVNIALMSAGMPLAGVIAAPAGGLLWRGVVGRGAERIELADGKSSAPVAIHVRPRPEHEPIILVSRSHLEERTRAFVARTPRAKLVPCGSSVKFCRLAEGTADLYPRLAPTHDWDIAAGHAILQAAGGSVAAPDGTPLRYGSADLLIPGFIAAGAIPTA